MTVSPSITTPPEAVVLPSAREEAALVIKIARRHGIPIVPRGSGTGLSGGALPQHGGIVLSLARMKQVLELDYVNRQALVQPGVMNQELSRAASASGY